MKIQGSSEVLGQPVITTDGRRTGIIVRLRRSDDDPYTVTWILIRLHGLRQRLRAVPATDATVLPYRGVRVPYDRHQIITSPPATDLTLGDPSWRHHTAAHYQNQ